MYLSPFDQLFEAVARDEYRHFVMIGEDEEGDGPLVAVVRELYCDDRHCDCRRVLLVPTYMHTGEPVAHISFGFDRHEPMAGPFLDPINVQSAEAEEMLAMVKETCLADDEYVARLERHYRMVKASQGAKGYKSPVAVLSPAEVQERIQERKARRQRLARLQKQLRGQRR